MTRSVLYISSIACSAYPTHLAICHLTTNPAPTNHLPPFLLPKEMPIERHQQAGAAGAVAGRPIVPRAQIEAQLITALLGDAALVEDSVE